MEWVREVWSRQTAGLQNPILSSGTKPAEAEVYGDADAAGVFHAPYFVDHTSGRTAGSGVVRGWHVTPGRSMVSGQRVLDIETEIGVIPVRTRMNGNLAEILAPIGAKVAPGQPLWRYAVSRQAAP